MKRLLMLLSTFAVIGCFDSTGPRPSDPANETFASSLNIGNLNDASQWQVTPSGTYFKDEIVGMGAVLDLEQPTDSMYVDYTGFLANGTSFESAVGVGFPVGNVIYGLLDGTVGMRVGGQRYIVIPSNLGYGNVNYQAIPPNSTLIFRIKLNNFAHSP